MRPEFYGIVHRYRFLINPVNGSPMDTRLTDVEIRLTHQEAALEEMNQVLLKQYQLIETLRHDLKILQRQLREVRASNVADLSEETPPPHY